MNQYIFYDTETSSAKEIDFVQVIQVGAIASSTSLNEIDTLDLMCTPLPWTVITPKALLLNKKKETFEADLSHYQMIKEVHNKWSKWTGDNKSIFISYNGMHFDEQIMRRQFYWNLLDPYITNTNGNSRLDIYIKMQVIANFYDHIFPIPKRDEKVSLKLEDFAKVFNMNTENAHDAVEDCRFLKNLFSKTMELTPNFFKEFISTTSKIDLFNHLAEEEVHYLCSYFYKNLKSFPFTALTGAEILSNELPIFNLENNPDDYFDLSTSQLSQIISDRRSSPFRKIGINKSIPSISAETLVADNIQLEGLDTYKERAHKIKDNTDFIYRVNDIINDLEKPIYPSDYIEQQLYSGGFPHQIDKDKMKNFHSAETLSDKVSIANSFLDERYKDFAMRICAQEFPADIEFKQLQDCQNLVTTRFTTKGPWPDAEEYLQEGESLLKEITDIDEKKLVNLALNSIKSSRN
tara:strand:- start:3020 stop:4408 length:1389 start_codon:yes stop_codon:yes gene_type:complete